MGNCAAPTGVMAAGQGYQFVNRYIPLARRVVGAWMAAIALLLGALALARP